MQKQGLAELTQKLLDYADKAMLHFERAKSGENIEPDFYKEVKPFADQVKQIADEWKSSAIQWIEKTNPKYIYPMQIENTWEQIQTVAVQSFYPDTSTKRFKELHQSVTFVLKNLLSKIS
jgi:Bacterial domain of unknown function (DUF1798)